MKHLTKLAAVGTAVAFMTAAPVLASDTNHGSHGTMNHGSMAADGMAEVQAKINSIDAANGMMNVSHGPVEALGWPSMTMDLPVTKRVDLSTVKAGDDVTLSLKQGRDKQFRIVGVEKN